MVHAFNNKSHLQEFWNAEQERLCFVSRGEILGEFTENAFGTGLQVSMMMKRRNDNGIENKGNKQKRQILYF